jgi:transcriptional regulator of arginine metabolism
MMRTKNLRLKEIRDIISKQKIGKQDDLLSILHRRGFNITQATLSRDLSQLNVARKSTKQYGSIYFLPEDNPMGSYYDGELLYGAKSIRFNGNLGVLKTLPGYANSVGAIIDGKGFAEVLGTVAGNDTILVIVAEGYSSEDVLQALGNTFSNVNAII